MRAQTLTEFAEDMRRQGDIRQSDLADEILTLIDIESDVAEPYSELTDIIESYAEDFSNPTDARRALEWLGDRSNLLEEIERELTERGHAGDVDDVIKELLCTIAQAKTILHSTGWPTTGDFIEGLHALVDNTPTPKEYDL